MPDLIWAVPCRTVITDSDTNSVSYIEATHALAAKKLPSALPKFVLATAWKASKPGDSLRMRVRLEGPDGSELAASEFLELKFTEEFQRLNINLAGTEVRVAGDHAIILERYSRGGWRPVTRVPVRIALAPEST